MIERHKVQHGSPEWRKLHDADVTASVLPAIFGCSPWETIGGLHARKMGLDIPGPDPESAVIRRGNALESVVAAEVGKLRSEWHITKCTEYLRDPEARIGCSIDFWIDDDPRGRGVLQTKTVGSSAFKRHWGDAAEPSPPLHVILQVATEMMLADAAFGAIGVLVIGDYTFETHIVEVPRHRPTEHKIRVAVHAFWEAIRAGHVPELDYARDGELIKSMYRITEPGKVIDLRGDNRIIDLLETREQQVELEKLAGKAREAAEAEIRDKLGDAEIGLVPGWMITNKAQTRKQPARPAREISFRVLRTRREE